MCLCVYEGGGVLGKDRTVSREQVLGVEPEIGFGLNQTGG